MTGQQLSRPSLNTGPSTMPQIEPQAPPRPSSTKRVPRDTGFPEPFHSGPNTTLPHPDADLSPNATISCDDASTERILKRHRLSFLKKNRRGVAVGHGTLDPHPEAPHSMASLSACASDGGRNPSRHFADASVTSLRLSRHGQDSLHSSSKKDEDDTPPTSPEGSDHRRRPGLFRKWKRS